MLLHDAKRNGHAETGARREIGPKGLEEALLIGGRHASAAVAEEDVVGAWRGERTHREYPTIGHRLNGIAGQVPEDLPDLVGISFETERVGLEKTR